MIQIIKPGTRKIAKCEECGCEFSYENEDICYVIASSFDIDSVITVSNAKTYVTCPQCKTDITLMQSKELGV